MKLSSLVQFIKFSAVGVMNTLVSYAVYMLCCYPLHTSPYIANAAAFLISVFNAYIWQNKFVFREHSGERPWWVVLLRTYVAYAFSGLVLAEVLTYMWLDAVKLGGYIGENAAVSAVPFLNLAVTVPVNFLLNKYWTYRGKGRRR